ncbi:MAG: nuclear transport factor 2 family protein [Gemmatimonadota bacterium]
MQRIATRLGLLAAAGFAPALTAQETPDTRTVTHTYVQLAFEQKYDDLLDVYAEDAVFFDPTGDVFQGRVAEGPVRGAEQIIALQKSWGITASWFDIQTMFTVGEYSLYRGILTVTFQGSDAETTFPFATVLRAQDGRVTERTDFGEYIQSFGLGDGFDANSESTREIADRYLHAYLHKDIDAQEELVATGVRYQDPTSKVFGPPSGELYEGAEALMDRRRQIYANLVDFELEIEQSFVANHHAVYMGTVRYSVNSGAAFAQPAVIVIEVRDGKVTRQWDFVDYTVGPVDP